ncbi:MAG: CBS domain-containing protein [Anaerolinea sp.]|nr:CBS domain-containing protein [Anaerolinea sp.]
MPISAKELIEGRQPPATVKESDLIPRALSIMLEYEYSQLPIVDDTRIPKGLVTADSILKAMDNFGVSAEKLRVRDAATRHIAFTPEVNVFDLLESLGSSPAVLIVDESARLISIITNYDMAVHFRERTEDLMFVEDIETALKEHIRASFSHAPNGTSDGELQEAIDKVANAPLISTADTAVRRYLSATGKEQLQPDGIKKVHDSFFRGGKSLGDMTLNQLIDLMLYPARWKDYQKHFTLDDKAIRTLLGEILDIRNTLAHFRDDLTPSQRSKLRFCAKWFERNSPVFRESSSYELGAPGDHLLRDANTATTPGTSLDTVVIITDPAAVETTYVAPEPATQEELLGRIEYLRSLLPAALLIDEERTGAFTAEQVVQTAPDSLRADYSSFLTNHNFEYRISNRITNAQCSANSAQFWAISYAMDRFATPEDAQAALEEGFLDQVAVASGFTATESSTLPYPVYTFNRTVCDVDSVDAVTFWQRGHFVVTVRATFPATSDATAEQWLSERVGIATYEQIFSDALRREMR